MLSDVQLLRQHAQHGSEDAFTELVARHTNLVYSTANAMRLPGVVSERPSPLADQDDTYYQVRRDGVDVILGGVAEKALGPALQAFAEAHNGEKPRDPSQLQPYAKTPAEQGALQNLLQNSTR
jgi:hypothetical protein